MCVRIIIGLIATLASFTKVNAADFTIPVVDLNEFYNPSTKQQFIEEVSKALHETGFFAVINTRADQKILDAAYASSQQFFTQSLEQKNEIYAPALNGQRGYVPGETAQGHTEKDFKEFVHIGKKNNLWPTSMEMQTSMIQLMEALDSHGEILQRAMALAMGEDENFLIDMTKEGDCLLRALHYPPNPDAGRLWAAKHTDINLFTILPMATEEGLQILHNGEWIDVKVPPNSFIINAGDKLQNLTNGYFKSCWHRVVAKPNLERYSIVYFVHPKDEDSVSPTPTSIAMTGGVQRYPEATSLELLACRLRELKLATPELLQFEQESHILDRIKDLVESGQAADPVKRTYDIWMNN